MPNVFKIAEVAAVAAEDAIVLAQRHQLESEHFGAAAVKMLRETILGSAERSVIPEAGEAVPIVSAATIRASLKGAETAAPIDFAARAKVVPNPYLEEYEAAQSDPVYREALAVARGRRPETTMGWREAYAIQEDTRNSLVHKYSWAVPNSDALATIAEQGPLIEAGAGTGYWSHLLKGMGTDVVSFDKHGTRVAENYYHRNAVTAWTDILEGGPQTVANYPNRSLFMSFPPHGEPFAKDVLDAYQGKRFAFVGEVGDGSCTGDKAFHKALETDWNEVKRVELPNWEVASGYLWDQLHLFERK